MRLVHAVLLPGIVVFVSKVNLLQAHALRGEEADDPTSGLRGSKAEAIADGESRLLNGQAFDDIAKGLGQQFKSTDATRTALESTVQGFVKAHGSKVARARNAKDVAIRASMAKDAVQLSKQLDDALVKHFKSLWTQWLSEKQLAEKFRIPLKFRDSHSYRTMIGLIGNINGRLPQEKRVSLVKTFTESMDKKKNNVARGGIQTKEEEMLAKQLRSDYDQHFPGVDFA